MFWSIVEVKMQMCVIFQKIVSSLLLSSPWHVHLQSFVLSEKYEKNLLIVYFYLLSL